MYFETFQCLQHRFHLMTKLDLVIAYVFFAVIGWGVDLGCKLENDTLSRANWYHVVGLQGFIDFDSCQLCVGPIIIICLRISTVSRSIFANLPLMRQLPIFAKNHIQNIRNRIMNECIFKFIENGVAEETASSYINAMRAAVDCAR